MGQPEHVRTLPPAASLRTPRSTDPEAYRAAKDAGRIAELPINHNPRFAPILHPTLETGIETLVVAACAWLGTESTRPSSTAIPTQPTVSR
jgi:hypothetical protein